MASHFNVYITICTVFFLLFQQDVVGTGRMLVPPQRSSLWRDPVQKWNPLVSKNYQDHTLNCGGLWKQKLNEGRCGVCGDAWDLPEPRPNEAGGEYGLGIIGRTYKAADRFFDVQIQVLASIEGYFEFRLCPSNGMRRKVTQECLDKNPLRIYTLDRWTAFGTRYYLALEPNKPGNISLSLEIPEGMNCAHCVLQWKWHGGNNWGTCKNGTSGIGCGPQEEFYNCADIAILDNGTPGTMMLPGSAIAGKNKPNVPVTLRPKNAFAPNGAVLSNALRNELQNFDGMKSQSSGPVNGVSAQPLNGGFTPLGMPGQIKPHTNIFGKQGLLDGTIDPRNLISPLLTPVFGMGYQRRAMASSPYGLNMVPGMVRETRSSNPGMNVAENVATSLLMTMLPENNTSLLMNDPMFARNNALDTLFRELVFKHPNKNVPGYFNLRLIDSFKDIVITHILGLLRQANESYFVLGQNGSSVFPPDFGKLRPSLESPGNLLTSLVNNYVGNLLSASSSGSLGTGFGLNKDLQLLLMLNAILAENRPSNAYVSSINGNFPNIFRSRRFGPTWLRNTRGTQRSIINPEMILLSTLLGRKSHSGGGKAGEDRHSGSSLFGKTLAMNPKLQKILSSLLTDSRSRTAESAPFKANLPNIFGSHRIEPMLRGPVVGTRQSTINPEMVLLSTLLGRKSRSGGGEASESSEGRSSSSFLGKTLATNPKLPILTPRLGPMMRENVGTQQPKINPEMMLFSTLLGRKARSGGREEGGRGGGEASESQVSSATGNLAGTSQLPMLAYMLGSNSGSGLGAKQLRGGNMAGMFGESVRVPMSPMTAQFLSSSPSYFGRTLPSSLPYPLLPAMLTGGQRRASNVAASLGLPDFSAFSAMSAGEMGFGRNSPLSKSAGVSLLDLYRLTNNFAGRRSARRADWV